MARPSSRPHAAAVRSPRSARTRRTERVLGVLLWALFLGILIGIGAR